MSGSTTVDWRNDSGLQRGEDAVLLAFYTYHGLPRGQYMAYSNDRGMTWTKYEGNPVLPGPGIADRDPKVFPFGGKWFMLVSYAWGPDVSRERFADHLYSSSDLKSWRHMGEVKDSVNFAECLDFFELPVDGDKTRRKWVLVSGNGSYIIGTFDGERFVRESGPHTGDYGNNFYATQTWDDGARRIQIAWMARDGRYPWMPFNQQMSFPCSLTLRTTANGVRMFRYPVEEIRTIRGKERRWTSTELVPGRNLLEGAPGELVDIEAEFEPNDAKEITFVIRGAPVTYRVPDGKLVCRSREAPLERVGNRIKLRILADRTSIEVFGNDGLVSMTNFFLPTPEDRELRLTSKGGLVKVILLKVRELRSAWGTQ
jgi:levanase/fructan beta-fructosidase